MATVQMTTTSIEERDNGEMREKRTEVDDEEIYSRERARPAWR